MIGGAQVARTGAEPARHRMGNVVSDFLASPSGSHFESRYLATDAVVKKTYLKHVLTFTSRRLRNAMA